jgi:capsular polysaccharide transport system permease protein
MTLRSNPEQLRLMDRLDVIAALIVRDLMARFGRRGLGFVWTILEPMILTAGVTIVWSLIRPAIYHGIPIVAFVLTLYMPLTLWRHLTNPLVRLMHQHEGLLYHRIIQQDDILAARLLLEFLSTSTALVIVLFVTSSFGLINDIADPSLLLAAWLYTAWLFSGVGMLLAAWTETWDPAEKFIQPLQYLSLPLSGAFFMVSWLPGYAQHLALANPTVHCFEMFRAGFFGAAYDMHYSVAYLTAWCMGLSVAGVVAVHRVRDRAGNRH